MKTKYNQQVLAGIMIVFTLLLGSALLLAGARPEPGIDPPAAGPRPSTIRAPDAAGVLYVDSAASGGSGDSWQHALTRLSDALQLANNDTAVKVIRVAAGTYYPTGLPTGTDRDSAFAILRGGLRLRGGYDAGSGQRDVENNATVLSGNIGDPSDSTDNSYHIVVIAGIGALADSIVIDGFSIRAANANGGGTKNYNGLPIKRNDGGGFFLYAVHGPLLIADCRIERNTAIQWGGGLYLAGSAPDMTRCQILHNQSGVGGGLLNDQQSAPRLLHCTIAGNTAWQNSGGGVFNNHSTPQFINCVIAANVSTGSNGGGGLRNFASSPVLINTVVADNQALYTGAGLRNNNASSPRLYNCILWNNTREGELDNIYNDDTDKDQPWFYCSYLQKEGVGWAWGGHVTGTNGGGNLIQTETPFAAAGDYHLKGGALAINAGDNDSIPADLLTDLAGNPRIFDGTVDMGAYEYQAISIVPDAAGIVYVDSQAAPGGSGDSWSSALSTLRQALQAANANSAIREIRVAAGHYYPTGEQSGEARDLAFALLRGGLKLRGGYEASSGIQAIAQHPTVLSGDIGVLGDSTDNSYHVLVLANLPAQADSVLIEGFTVTGGNANGGMHTGQTYNGLLVAEAHGGGVYMDKVHNATVMRRCAFTGNTALHWGAGLYINNGSVPRLVSCVIARNHAVEAGGGVLNNKKSEPAFINCTLARNKADSNSGGALFNNDSDPFFVNCIIAENRSEGSNGGGGMRNFKSAPVLINCVVADNQATAGAGGGLRNNGGAAPVITNSVLWNNSSKGAVENIHNDGGSDNPRLAFTFLQGDPGSWQWNMVYSGTDGGGNVIGSSSPFVHADSGDFHLAAGSPAINGGNNDSVPPGMVTDLAGDPRFVDGSVDMGAFEDQNGPVMVIIQPDAAGIVYVSDSAAPGGNGSSWQEAVNTLSAALKTASHKTAIKEIRVAGGVYYPTGVADTVVRDSAFVITRGGLKLLGGYEAQSGLRKRKTQPTILSGDIGIAGDSTDNSYHVLVISGVDTTQAEIILNGFTIRDGQADGSGSHWYDGRSVPRSKGGGIYIDSVLINLIVERCTVEHNTADSGGGLFCGQGSSPWVFRGVFSNNTAVHKGGGGYIATKSSPWFVNTVFYTNRAGNKGGALYNDHSMPFLTNDNFYGNTAGDKGGALYNNAGSNAVISNTIVYGNGPDGLYDHESTPVVAYSIIQGISVDSMRHVYAADPAFLDPANGNFHLQPGSPAIDAGSDSAYAASGGNLGSDKDAGGIPRLYGGAIDMGAREFFNCPGITTLHVDAEAVTGGDGSSWGQPLLTLSQALQIAAYCPEVDSILVAKGVYYPTGAQSGTNRDSAFVVPRGGLVLLGGYAASSGQRDWEENETVLSGNIGDSGDSLDNSYHVMVIPAMAGGEADIRVAGFTISGGYADPNEPGSKLVNGQPVYRNNGGGIYTTGVFNKTVIAHCRIRDNQAYFGGGVFNVDHSGVQMVSCTISANQAAFGGGMTNGNGSGPRLVNCVFAHNTASFEGGAIANTVQSKPEIINCTITDNTANGKGGGIYNGKSSPALVNQSLNNNTCSGLDLAAFMADYSQPSLSNTIVWGNYDGGGNADNVYSFNSARPVYRNSYLQGDSVLWNWDGLAGGIDSSGNIISLQSPFKDPAAAFHLDSGAWAVDAGRNDLLPEGITRDAAGNVRIVHGVVDMGAFEFSPAAPFARVIVSQPEDTAVCSGETAVFKVRAKGPHLHYQWQYYAGETVWRNTPRANAATLVLKKVEPQQDGRRYRVVVTAASRRDTSGPVALTVYPSPEVSITADRPNPVPSDQFVRLSAAGGSRYHWQAAPGLSRGYHRREVTVIARQATKYTVTATDSNGCSALRRYALRVEKKDSLRFLNILTPNGDGINDQWVIPNLEQYADNVLQIFDRAGRLVYRKKNYANAWRGTVKGRVLPTGVYYFIFTAGAGKKVYKGSINLIRDEQRQTQLK